MSTDLLRPHPVGVRLRKQCVQLPLIRPNLLYMLPRVEDGRQSPLRLQHLLTNTEDQSPLRRVHRHTNPCLDIMYQREPQPMMRSGADRQ